MQINKKVIFVASYAESLINFRLHLMQEFLKKNYVVIATAPDDKQVASDLMAAGIQFKSIELQRNGLNPIKDIAYFRQLFLLLYNEKPTIVFSYTIKPVIYGTLAAKLANVKHIYAMITGLGYMFNSNTLKSKVIGVIGKNLYKLSLRFNQKLFFQNKDDLNLFLRNKLISAKKPTAIINGSGVDINYYHPADYPAVLSFLMLARLVGDKGIREYVEAARIIKAQYPTIQFKLAGALDTNPTAINKQELAQWQASGNIEYLGKLSDVRPAIADSSVYVLPSYGEGTPRSVLEAMSMMRPIITTDVPGCRETVINQNNGYLVAARNVGALCHAMPQFIENPDYVTSMGNESRKIAVEKYDVHKVNRSILIEMNVI